MNNNYSPTTLKEALLKYSKQLSGNPNIHSANIDARLLIANVINKPKSWIISHDDFFLSEAQVYSIDKLINLRLTNIPIAYLLKYKEFYRRRFYCDERVLVPRPESEDVIELVLKSLKKSSLSLLDIGCGSGILGITLKLEQPFWSVTLSDVSSDALDVAKKNLNMFGLSDKIKLQKADLIPKNTRIDAIVANLPYVPNSFNTNQDLEHEPKIALFAGDDGLDCYRRLFLQLAQLKEQPDFLFLESLPIQHKLLTNLAKDASYKFHSKYGYAICYKK